MKDLGSKDYVELLEIVKESLKNSFQQFQMMFGEDEQFKMGLLK